MKILCKTMHFSSLLLHVPEKAQLSARTVAGEPRASGSRGRGSCRCAGRSGAARHGGSRAAGAAVTRGGRRPQLPAVQHDTEAGSVPGTAQSTTALRSTGSES